MDLLGIAMHTHSTHALKVFACKDKHSSLAAKHPVPNMRQYGTGLEIITTQPLSLALCTSQLLSDGRKKEKKIVHVYH